MKFHTEYLTLHTKTKRAYIHLTPHVETILKKSGIKDGKIGHSSAVAQGERSRKNAGSSRPGENAV